MHLVVDDKFFIAPSVIFRVEFKRNIFFLSLVEVNQA